MYADVAVPVGGTRRDWIEKGRLRQEAPEIRSSFSVFPVPPAVKFASKYFSYIQNF